MQSANTDLFDTLVPTAHNSECQNLLFPLQIKPEIDSYSYVADLFFGNLGTNGLNASTRQSNTHPSLLRDPEKPCIFCHFYADGFLVVQSWAFGVSLGFLKMESSNFFQTYCLQPIFSVPVLFRKPTPSQINLLKDAKNIFHY